MASRFSHPISHRIAATALLAAMALPVLAQQPPAAPAAPTAPAKAAYEKFRNPASRYAIVGVFVAKDKDGVRVAVTGAGDDGVFRAKPLEAALTKKFDASALDGARIDAGSLMSDMHASADYRAHLVVVMAKRAVAAANG